MKKIKCALFLFFYLTALMPALAVNIERMPTHIAGLPVAVNISCHVTRRATVTL